MRVVTIKEMETYESLHDALKKASEAEQLLRSGGNESHGTQVNAIKLFEEASLNQLPASVGKLISELELQSQFQSLGRYVRSFTDAEFVIRNLREQILIRLNDNVVVDAAISSLIKCCESLTTQLIG